MHLIGHRGAKAEAPENTLAGFRHLRELGIHRVELDIQLAKDGELVVLHDKTLERTTNQQGLVYDFTAAELNQVNASAKAMPHWPLPQGIPSLAQVLDEWPELELIQLEVKATSDFKLRRITIALGKMIKAYRIERKAIITSSHRGFLKLSNRRNSHVPHGLVAERYRYNPIRSAQSLGCQYLMANWRICSPRLMDQCHRRDMPVSVWTVNDPRKARELRRMGAHSIITDVPSKMLKEIYN